MVELVTELIRPWLPWVVGVGGGVILFFVTRHFA